MRERERTEGAFSRQKARNLSQNIFLDLLSLLVY